MKGDFTRVTFDPLKHYRRVLKQQGRVDVDADSNEQTAILLHYLQTLAADLIGGVGGPRDNLGFGVAIKSGEKGFVFGRGRYYVDGILCENEDTDRNYLSQPDYPIDGTDAAKLPDKYLVYLDVWERHLTWVNDSMIRETALGGPDTATRSKVVWQVKFYQPIADDALTCQNIFGSGTWKAFTSRAMVSRGKLKVRLKPTDDIQGPCSLAPDVRYRGVENHLYRVEIHQGGKIATNNVPSIKWSRDNASVAYPVVQFDAGKATLTHIGRDRMSCLKAKDWVELEYDEKVLRGEAGFLLQVENVDPTTMTVTFKPTSEAIPSLTKEQAKAQNALLRRWDMREGAIANMEGTTEKEWIDLEDGIQIQFQPAGHTYRTGDYWLIPARVATGDIEYPSDVALPPFGIEHHCAPLAAVNTASTNPVTDLRRIIYYDVMTQCKKP